MEEKYKLEKEYSISANTFREGYLAFQKKYIYVKSYIFMGIFTLLAADFIYAAVKDPKNYFAYLLIVICLSLAFREWYNPRKIRRSLVDTVKELGEPVYKIGVGESFVDISTVSVPDGIEEETGEGETESDESSVSEESDLPEPTRIPADEKMNILEYDEFFLLIYGKAVFYIIPKENFEEKELEVIRNIKK
ncbi:MAG: YcxB family protein [Ruminococcus sp.]|nr:YcxB family protein [Ruminococcus sp.]